MRLEVWWHPGGGGFTLAIYKALRKCNDAAPYWCVDRPQLVNWLLTGLSTGLLVCAVGVYFAARGLLHDALYEVRRFRGSAARLTAAEGDLAALSLSHRKLSGKLYGYIGSARAEEAGNQTRPERSDAPVDPSGASRDVCENWHAAQLEGPRSRAAKCECAYCEAMRAYRRSLKVALAPTPNPARVLADGNGE